jgi:hypothetical protein
MEESTSMQLTTPRAFFGNMSAVKPIESVDSWLITIKNGAIHPLVTLGIYNNHYFRILIMDGMTNQIVSIDHGAYHG